MAKASVPGFLAAKPCISISDPSNRPQFVNLATIPALGCARRDQQKLRQ